MAMNFATFPRGEICFLVLLGKVETTNIYLKKRTGIFLQSKLDCKGL